MDKKINSRKIKSIGLRFKVIFGIALITMTIIIGMTFVLLDKAQQDIFNQVEKNARLFMKAFTKSLKLMLENKPQIFYTPQSAQKIQKLVEEFIRDTEVLEMYIVDKEFQIIAHNDSRLVGGKRVEEDMKMAMEKREVLVNIPTVKMKILSAQNEPITIRKLEISSPIILGGVLLGGVKSKFSLQEVQANINFSRKKTLQYSLLETVVVILFSGLLLSIWVIRPIQKLVEITGKIAEGELDHDVEIDRTDEFGLLAHSIDIMNKKLSANRLTLIQNIDSLEKAYSQLKKTQQELIESEKQASIGRLAAGVAHEIGNPLSSILGYTDILLMGVEDDKERMDYLMHIQQEINRIKQIIQDLLDFSRPKKKELRKVILYEVIDKTIRLVSAQKIFHSIQINNRIDNDIPLVMADEQQLQQVFMNVLLNSAQAMQGKGQIIIEANKDENFVYVYIEDTGPGVPEEIEKNIFDPFFTTKETSKGTGLGLSICKTLIEGMCGAIRYIRKIGHGAIFEIKIPIAKS